MSEIQETPPPPPNYGRENRSNKQLSSKLALPIKITGIIVIVLLLMWPTSMVEDLIRGRQRYKEEALNGNKGINTKWAKEQTIVGPIISIPYYEPAEQITNKNAGKKKLTYFHILPSQLNIKGKVEPIVKHRGIFETVVYAADLQITGSFDGLLAGNPNIETNDLLLTKAVVSFGISDLKGITEELQFYWIAQFKGDSVRQANPPLKFDLESGLGNSGLLGEGVFCNIDLTQAGNKNYTFSLNLKLNGAENLKFIPIGKTSKAQLTSDWQHPSFVGGFLPQKSTVNKNGFVAHWNILHLNRSFPQRWVSGEHNINPKYQPSGFNESAYGVSFMMLVDNYTKTMRSVKYAFLFILLTFIAFLFIELINKKYIHPIQYMLVGLALVVFFSLLLSLSEHIGFNAAYIASALATTALIGWYVLAILKILKISLSVSGILMVLYGFIFILLQLEDLAMLIGSIGIFVILALVMYYSRNLDWAKGYRPPE